MLEETDLIHQVEKRPISFFFDNNEKVQNICNKYKTIRYF